MATHTPDYLAGRPLTAPCNRPTPIHPRTQMTQSEVKKWTPRKGKYAGAQDWTVNLDGTVDHTATVVKGAVDQFARERVPPRQVQVGYREYAWNTWAIRK